MARQPPDQLEGRNIVLEALRRRRRPLRRIFLDARARPDAKLKEILWRAGKAEVTVEEVRRQQLDKRSLTGVHNGIIALAEPLPELTVSELLEDIWSRNEQPFLVLVDEAQYEHNLGAVLRSALGAGVHGVIVPTRRGKGLTPVVQRVSMGGAEAVPLVREGLSSALKQLRKGGVRIVGADMGGEAVWGADLTGPVAFVIGGESKGLSPTLARRCDSVVAVPLEGHLESLNLSVTAGVLLFEKVRQEHAARVELAGTGESLPG